MKSVEVRNEKFRKALLREQQPVPPVWFMRQAGRYHAHYQNLKKTYTFEQLCKLPDVAAETALGPVLDFDFDVSILFSDLLFPLEALGMGLKYDPAPRLEFALSPETYSRLKNPDEAWQTMAFQKQALLKTRQVLPQNKSLIGFVGGPWTLFTYAVEGGHKGNLIETKRNIPLWEKFSEMMTHFLIKNIELQLEGGAEVVMIFDTAAGELAPDLFRQLNQPALEKIVERFPGRIGYYSKGTTRDHLDHSLFRGRPWAGLGVDHRFDLPKLLKENFSPGFLQGNFDQALLFSEPKQFRRLLNDYLAPFKNLTESQRSGWVSGLGHGVLPQTPEDNVREFVQIIRSEFLG